MFHTGKNSFKYRCLERDPRITLCIDTKIPPYKAVVLKGRVTMAEHDDSARTLRMAVAYLGEKLGRAYAKSLEGEKVVVVSFRPERVISWDYASESRDIGQRRQSRKIYSELHPCSGGWRMLGTRICDLFGIELPIVSAGIGGVALARLAAAVSEAGGNGHDRASGVHARRDP